MALIIFDKKTLIDVKMEIYLVSPLNKVCQVLCKGAPLYKRSGFLKILFDIVEDRCCHNFFEFFLFHIFVILLILK